MRNTIKRHQTLGFFVPTAFHLHVSSDVDVHKWREWDDTTLCTFFHEYIHYLQDIMTGYGLRNFFINGEYLAWAANFLYKQPKGEFKTPLLPPEDINNSIYVNMEISQFTEAANDPPGKNYDLKVTGKVKVTPQQVNVVGQNIDVPVIEVPTDSGDFVLGGYHIIESMAYLAEEVVYPDDHEPSPNYPYDIVSQLSTFYIPDVQDRKKLLFGLCDIALMFSHPAKALVDMFESISNATSLSDDYHDIVSHFANAYKTKSIVTGEEISMSQALQEHKQLIYRAYDNIFSTIEYEPVRKWYHIIIDDATSWWAANNLLLCNLLDFGELKHNKIFETFLSRFGLPIVSNSKNKTFVWNTPVKVEKKQLSSLYAANSIIGTLQYGPYKCDLFDYCKAEGACVDCRCCYTPWKRARKICACPYGHLWYGRKLYDYEPI